MSNIISFLYSPFAQELPILLKILYGIGLFVAALILSIIIIRLLQIPFKPQGESRPSQIISESPRAQQASHTGGNVYQISGDLVLQGKPGEQVLDKEGYQSVGNGIQPKSYDKRGVFISREPKDFSILWVSENAYFLREPKGGQRPYSESVETESTILGLDCDIVFKPMLGRIRVESLWLDIAGGIAKPSGEWMTEVFVKETKRNLIFDIPANIQRGERTAKLKAIVDGAEYDCETFIIDLPQRK